MTGRTNSRRSHTSAGDDTRQGAIAFGPFRLIGAERLLLRDGVPVTLGARSLDLLIALTEQPGEALGKQELMDRVWPGVTVDEGSLRVHMAGLRRALGEDGASYIVTLPGAGYSFVAPPERTDPAPAHGPDRDRPAGARPLPALPPGMVGREVEARDIEAQLLARRFVTILGPGGIGKTTVAIPIAHSLLEAFDGAVHFVDLGPVSDPKLVPSALAATLGLLVQSSDPLGTLTTYLLDKRLLIVVDSCEHVIDAAAAVLEAIHQRAPGVHLLVTSREVMRAQGEFTYRLPPLEVPPTGASLTAEEALGFAAVQLFVDRVAAAEDTFRFTDADAPTVCEICRKLDGIALAIELAAGRVGAYGVQQTAQLLEGQFSLLWQGRRTALPRHQTLSATLDWSYDLLTEPERLMLRRLSAFSGRFTLGAAEAVMAGQADAGMGSGPGRILDGLASLVGKSMVVADTRERPAMYRLLDTTRAYAETKLVHSGERNDVARRHAAYFAAFLPGVNEGSPDLSKEQNYTRYAGHLGNVRSALEWSFGPDGDSGIGTALAAAASRMFLQLSLLTECHHWAGRGIAALGGAAGTVVELELQASLGQSIMFSRGNSQAVRAAFLRGLELAKQLGNMRYQLQLLGGLHIFHERIGDFATAMTFAQQSLAVANGLGDEGGIAAAHSFMGISLHLEGHQVDAQRHIEAALSCVQAARGIHFGFDHRNRARITLARTLWIQGHCADAVAVAEHTVEEATRLEHPVTVCIALIWAVSVYLWSGDWAKAEAGISQFAEHAERHSLAPYLPVGSGVKGELAVHNGDAAAGVAALQQALATLHEDRYELLTTAFLCAISEGQARLGQHELALATLDGAIAQVEENGDRFLLPELLRTRGEVLAGKPTPDRMGAEACFRRALDMAGGHGAVAWELRAAISLAHLLAVEGRQGEGRAALADAVGRMSAGSDTADLRTARHLLADD